MVKRCRYCGKYFTPDRRVGARQKACGRAECKHMRKIEAQSLWSGKNPGYFRGRYEYVKEWRFQRKAKNPGRRKMIQDEIPPPKPLQELVLLIPASRMGMIQDEIRLRRVDTSTFAAYGP
ncbi:MAG: hypothetical protein M0022_09790 [Desulfobacteraceae bacterium]|nr:hypothetical protein [Desulfobacteraceae bacterium]